MNHYFPLQTLDFGVLSCEPRLASHKGQSWLVTWQVHLIGWSHTWTTALECETQMVSHVSQVSSHNTLNPVYSVTTVCHQVRCMHWGHPIPFNAANSLSNYHTIVCMGDLLYELIWTKSTNMPSLCVQSGIHRCVHWRVIAVLTQNPTILMFVDINEAPKL